jgi:hypothetical protein
MKKQTLWLAGLFAFIALVLNFQFALAHEGIAAGDYEIVFGWASEPPIAGQPNGIVIHVTDNSTGEEQPVEDVSSLIVTLSYGGQSKELEFEALGEHNPGEFQAPVLPTIPGKYTLHFGGTLGDTDVDAEVEPEEVQPVETLQFPVEENAASTEQAGQSTDLGMLNWLTYLSLLVGLIALVLAVMALRRAR